MYENRLLGTPSSDTYATISLVSFALLFLLQTRTTVVSGNPTLQPLSSSPEPGLGSDRFSNDDRYPSVSYSALGFLELIGRGIPQDERKTKLGLDPPDPKESVPGFGNIETKGMFVPPQDDPVIFLESAGETQQNRKTGDRIVEDIYSNIGDRMDGIHSNIDDRIEDGIDSDIGDRMDDIDSDIGNTIDDIDTSIGDGIDSVLEKDIIVLGEVRDKATETTAKAFSVKNQTFKGTVTGYGFVDKNWTRVYNNFTLGGVENRADSGSKVPAKIQKGEGVANSEENSGVVHAPNGSEPLKTRVAYNLLSQLLLAVVINFLRM